MLWKSYNVIPLLGYREYCPGDDLAQSYIFGLVHDDNGLSSVDGIFERSLKAIKH